MIIRIDHDNEVRLVDPDDCKKFHVEASRDGGGDLNKLLGAAGSVDDAGEDHVWIHFDWVRNEASGRVAADWAPQFDAMVRYAATKGWLNEAGTSIRAHIEWQ